MMHYVRAKEALAEGHSLVTLDLSVHKQVPDDVSLVIYSAPRRRRSARSTCLTSSSPGAVG